MLITSIAMLSLLVVLLAGFCLLAQERAQERRDEANATNTASDDPPPDEEGTNTAAATADPGGADGEAQDKLPKETVPASATDPDGPTPSYRNVHRWVAIGDLHGDWQAYRSILLGLELINAQGDWIGGDTYVIFIGDLCGGKPGTRQIIDSNMKLKSQAESQGGRIIELLGNQDIRLAAGDFSNLTPEEQRNLVADMSGPVSIQARLRARFLSPDSPYAQWLRSRPIGVKINGVEIDDPELPTPARGFEFVHAGITKHIAKAGVRKGLMMADLNRTALAWMRHWQGQREMPPLTTAWVMGVQERLQEGRVVFSRGKGPAFTRVYGVTREQLTRAADERAERDGGEGIPTPDGAPKPENLRALAAAWGVSTFVYGHAPLIRATRGGPRQIMYHPAYPGLVLMIDTNMKLVDTTQPGTSASQKGRVSAVTWSAQQGLRFRYFDTPVPAVVESQSVQCEAVTQ